MTLITTRFTDRSTADDVVAGIDLTGRRAVVTGASSGIGVETARSLARAGAEVVVAVRNTAAGDRTAADITASTGSTAVRVAYLDLVDRASVAAFAAAWEGPLHLLVANAGIMATPLTRTPEGWESQFATNHLGHLGLAVGLHDALAAAGDARVVSLSSVGHHASPVVFDDLMFEHREYEPWAGYGQAKTANVLFAVEATRHWAADGIVANAVMPGGIMTGLQKHVGQDVLDSWQRAQDSGKVRFKSVQEGAATTLVAAVAPEFAGVGGRYLEDCQEAPVSTEGRTGVRPYALDPESAERLWDVSLALLQR
ncbi:SDR family NAD(P)-dependent oxidoreductase [Modestobacter sp. I12A-02628]|uniref:Probable oxidoreductase n=1 Tax=Goekera deserti TaxID=2497753 RepID=A0A7K3WBQ0_9ACTN|nr:SDR family NAD(P)-dependent oxidoreductase [Goekera deserti]MPQ97390.1 SDR family NAD(P)-dependent oxidoreductase [Goekera deserti]NDI48009.1 SDR family NAD(P)-dependent oxidoreductase [Goekera deserti]NEL53757.1 SDR family NAD(P)-dependent oxidoreductase [Goekera deserti]